MYIKDLLENKNYYVKINSQKELYYFISKFERVCGNVDYEIDYEYVDQKYSKQDCYYSFYKINDYTFALYHTNLVTPYKYRDNVYKFDDFEDVKDEKVQQLEDVKYVIKKYIWKDNKEFGISFDSSNADDEDIKILKEFLKI